MCICCFNGNAFKKNIIQILDFNAMCVFFAKKCVYAFDIHM